MKNNSKRFAPIGLILSGLATITMIGVLIVRGFISANLYTALDPELLDQIIIIATAVFIIGLALFSILDPNSVRKFLTGRQIRYGSNSLILLVAFVGILIVLNILAYRYPQRWDVTEDKERSLAPETIQALQKLPEPVNAIAFYSFRVSRESAGQLLEDFRVNSAGNFDYEFMNPDDNPGVTNKFGITGDSKILLQMGENHEIVSISTEQELTGGLIRLLNPDQPTIYFLTGEGEHDIETAGDRSYTDVRQVLENKNYIVKTLNLQAENMIPEDARAVVVAGPMVPFTKESVALIKDYMEAGGSMLVLTNPVFITDLGEEADLLVEYLNSEWGIALNNDIVIDTNSPYSPFSAVGAQYAQHPITEKMQGIAAIFPNTRSITINTENLDVSPTPLVLTIDQSWGETDFEALEQDQIAFDEDLDILGPMILAAAAENTETNSRVVVFGGSSFALDGNFDFAGNADLFVNSVDWAVEQESLIGITKSPPTVRTFNPPGSLQLILTVVSITCIIPLAIIISGTYAWVLRRRRG
ncbi:MAG: Gldg family protein [Anaerolineae bacterium]|nr:Gldg family protein [Anaerolineae bacterium]MDK1080261.1 Gldg family protein [Anaerolineae bacterium]